jgi:hypothetical protein
MLDDFNSGGTLRIYSNDDRFNYSPMIGDKAILYDHSSRSFLGHGSITGATLSTKDTGSHRYCYNLRFLGSGRRNSPLKLRKFIDSSPRGFAALGECLKAKPPFVCISSAEYDAIFKIWWGVEEFSYLSPVSPKTIKPIELSSEINKLKLEEKKSFHIDLSTAHDDGIAKPSSKKVNQPDKSEFRKGKK